MPCQHFRSRDEILSGDAIDLSAKPQTDNQHSE
jgi:hypothetical protein